MAVKKKKVKIKSNAEMVRDSNQRKKDAGLIYGKVWMHPEEAAAVRKYAAKKPKTKACLEKVKQP